MKMKTHASSFGDARWIWPAELGKVVNHTLEFRQTVVCGPRAGAGARLFIAADTVYAIWVNGEFVDSGRSPDVPPERGYDAIPLGAALQRGRNELVVGLYVQGVNSFQHLPDDPGLVFAVRGRGVAAFSGRIPILGIPAGVKMYSAVFAVTPSAAAEILSQAGEAFPHLKDAEIVDVDEDLYRSGELATRLYATALTPYQPALVQERKRIYLSGDEEEFKDQMGGTEIPESDAEKLTTVGKVIEYIESKSKK